MRKFILNLSLMVLLATLFNFVVFAFAQRNYFSFYKRTPSKDYNSFLFADSHGLALEGHSEDFGVFNFSAGSDSYLDIRRKINFLINNDYKVDTVFITVDDHTLSEYRENNNNTDRSIVFATSDDFDTYYDYLKSRYIKYYFPIFQPKVRSLLKAYLNARLFMREAKDTGNKSWHQLSKDEKIGSAVHRMKSQFPSGSTSAELRAALSELIKICRKNRIELIGVKFPLAKEYVEVLDGRNYGADKLFEHYRIKVMDYKELFLDRDEYFENQDHLNSMGGRVLSRRLFDR